MSLLAPNEKRRSYGPRDCRRCKHYVFTPESWELPNIGSIECLARPGVENLTSFPFRNTKCKKFESK